MHPGILAVLHYRIVSTRGKKVSSRHRALHARWLGRAKKPVFKRRFRIPHDSFLTGPKARVGDGVRRLKNRLQTFLPLLAKESSNNPSETKYFSLSLSPSLSLSLSLSLSFSFSLSLFLFLSLSLSLSLSPSLSLSLSHSLSLSLSLSLFMSLLFVRNFL